LSGLVEVPRAELAAAAAAARALLLKKSAIGVWERWTDESENVVVELDARTRRVRT
jgi:hypothetical protein